MLSTILGSVLGFAGSALGPVVGYFEQKTKAKMEIKKLEHVATLAKAGFEQEQVMYALQSKDDEHARLLQHDIAISKSTGIMGSLQKSVRPIITYSFFALFAYVEYTVASSLIAQGLEMKDVMPYIWDDDTKAIFATIITFWFGNRVFEKRVKGV